jgi:hypothetical protein
MRKKHHRKEGCRSCNYAFTFHFTCFECTLHVAYRLDIKNGKLEAQMTNQNEIQDKNKSGNDLDFKGLLVDKPKPSSGTTNDVNTAKNFVNILIKVLPQQGLMKTSYAILVRGRCI